MNNYNYTIKSLLLATMVFASNAFATTIDTEKQLLAFEQIELNTQTFELIESQNIPVLIAAENITESLILYDKNAFHVIQNDTLHKVQECFVDPLLKDVSSVQLVKFLENGCISVNKTEDGSFTLSAGIRGCGGGATGAVVGFWIGKVATHGIALGISVGVGTVVGMVATPATGGFVTAWLSNTLAAPVELLSNKVGWATGMMLMVATGPI